MSIDNAQKFGSSFFVNPKQPTLFCLQSLKMLIGEWSRSGRVIWCNARPVVKEQLDAVLHEPIYCDTENLRMFLTGKYIYNFGLFFG